MSAQIVRLPVARPAGDFIVEKVADEVLVYDQRNHVAHCLSPVAALVWSLCDGGKVDRVRAALADAGHKDSVEAVIAQLSSAGLLRAPERVDHSRRRMLGTTAVAAGVVLASPVIFSLVSPSVAQAASAACGAKTQICCTTAPKCNITLRCQSNKCL
ncbi:MAG: PqqD family protein [Polyangia bacterium]